MSEREDKVQIVHFADPWCFWSWGLEPLLQRLRVVYGDNLQVVYRMGGVFEDLSVWQRTYRVDDESTATWIIEVGKTTGVPSSPHYGSVTNVQTSHPSCRAVKAAQQQDGHKAERYFRHLMEVFQVETQQATDDTLLRAAADVGLDPERLASDMASEEVQAAFTADRHAMAAMGVDYLSLVVAHGDEVTAVSRVFKAEPFEKLIDKMVPGLPKHQPTNILEYLADLRAHLVHTREVAEVFRIPDDEAERRLRELYGAQLVELREFDFARYWVPKAWSPGDATPDAALVG